VNTGAAINWEELAVEDSFAGELFRFSAALTEDEQLWRDFAKNAVVQAAGHVKLGRLMQSQWDELPERWLDHARELTLGLLHDNERGG
jgi:exonuclease SbcD